MNAKIAVLDANMYDKNGFYNNYIYENIFKRLDLYEDINKILDYEMLLIPMCCDEVFLSRNIEILKEFLSTKLNQKKRFFISFYPFVGDFLGKHFVYYPSKIEIKDRELFIINDELKCVNDYDINYRRGVKGFFNRGFINPPNGAKIWIKDCENKCVCYEFEDENTHILASAGACLFSFGLFENNTARRMGLKTIEILDKKRKKTI